ncbi:MAG: hypothetical protein LC775_02300 [Acidobacteria bacterium]|nr:hypothetical protein [Acidobacteriota bacterium]
MIAKSEPAYSRVRVLLGKLKEVVDQAHTAIKSDHNDVNAGMVLAAGALMGLVTESPDGYRRKPSEMTRKASVNSKETRQSLAAEWLIPPAGGDRQFRHRQEECLQAFRHALLDRFEAEYVVHSVTGQTAAQEARPAISDDTEQRGFTLNAGKALEKKPRHSVKRFAVIGITLVLLVAVGITLWRMSDGSFSNGYLPIPPSSGTNDKIPKTVVVQNKYATGPSSLLEDSSFAYLSTSSEPYCSRRGCKVDGTDMKSGVPLPVDCWLEGEEMTNQDTTSSGIEQNPHGVTSRLWYRGIWPDGRTGYLSEVYVEPRYRGGLGLPRCES